MDGDAFQPIKQQKRRDSFQSVDKLCRKLFRNKHPFQLEYDMIINDFAFAIAIAIANGMPTLWGQEKFLWYQKNAIKYNKLV